MTNYCNNDNDYVGPDWAETWDAAAEMEPNAPKATPSNAFGPAAHARATAAQQQYVTHKENLLASLSTVTADGALGEQSATRIARNVVAAFSGDVARALAHTKKAYSIDLGPNDRRKATAVLSVLARLARKEN